MDDSIQLRLLRQRGLATDGVLPVAGNGACLADLLCEDAHADEATPSRELKDFSLERHGGGWWIVNRSHSLVCSLNRMKIGPGERLRATVGDVLEAGLSRFAVETAGAGRADHADLSDRADVPVAPAARIEPVGGLPIRDDAVSAQASALALRELGDTGRFGVPFGHDDYPFALVEPARGRQATSDAAESHEHAPAVDIIDQLRAECDRALDEPLSTMNWSGFAAIPDRASERDAASHDVGAGDAHASLHDVVLGPLRIDDVIAQLDDLGETALFFSDETPEVLRAFVPAGARPVRRPTPALVRRDHHSVTADSHYRMTAAEPLSPSDPS